MRPTTRLCSYLQPKKECQVHRLRPLSLWPRARTHKHRLSIPGDHATGVSHDRYSGPCCPTSLKGGGVSNPSFLQPWPPPYHNRAIALRFLGSSNKSIDKNTLDNANAQQQGSKTKRLRIVTTAVAVSDHLAARPQHGDGHVAGNRESSARLSRTADHRVWDSDLQRDATLQPESPPGYGASTPRPG